MQLSELKDVNLDLRQLAIDTIKYQNFKTKSFLINTTHNFKETTRVNYFEAGLCYLNTKVERKMCNSNFYRYLDEAIKNHVQPLVPNEENKRRVHKNKYHKKDAIPPIKKLIDSMKEQASVLTEKFEYGVRYNDTIKVFDTHSKAKLFLDGIRFAGSEGRLVEIKDLEE